MDKMLPKQVTLPNVNNKDWNSYKKLWKEMKIIRNQAELCIDPEIKKELKEREIEISRKIVTIAKTLTDGKGIPIAVPMFPILGSSQ